MTPSAAVSRELRLTEPELAAWGEQFGRRAAPPLLIAIRGDLGAGKTTLARAICRGYGVNEPVTSPTFSLVHEYSAPRSPVYHLDLYRLNGPGDLTNLAWDDIVSDRALVIVEWPERAGERLPPSAVRVRLSHLPGDSGIRALQVADGPADPRP